ncbi:hypothetical protein CB1_000113010 [Camelus ferus]|nr:hypothetical protein CB1_000113010 [Camelus ferus]
MRCIENYTGARCEEVFLPSSSIQIRSDLFTAFVALAVLGTLIIGALYFLCRKSHLQRAGSVQCDLSLVETSSTGAHHRLVYFLHSLIRSSEVQNYVNGFPRRLKSRHSRSGTWRDVAAIGSLVPAAKALNARSASRYVRSCPSSNILKTTK